MGSRSLALLFALISITYLSFVYVQYVYIHEDLPPIASSEQRPIQHSKVPLADYKNVKVLQEVYSPKTYTISTSCYKRYLIFSSVPRN